MAAGASPCLPRHSLAPHHIHIPLHASYLCLAWPALQLARVREEASVARSEASRCRAEAEFERDRSTRLAESAEMQRQQVESMIGSNAKYQALLTDTERKLAQAQAAADESRDTVRTLPPPTACLPSAPAFTCLCWPAVPNSVHPRHLLCCCRGPP